MFVLLASARDDINKKQTNSPPKPFSPVGRAVAASAD